MKITTILLFACFLSVSATTMAQKITLKEKNASLGNVLNQIRRQSGYDVICRDELLNKSAPVTLTLNNATLDDALKASLQDQSLTYEIEDGTIIIKEKEVSLSDKAKAIFAQVTVIAKVFDEQGKPLLGVTVKEIGTENATLTDSQGHFSLTVANEKSVLSFSFIGFETQEYAANKIVNASIITLKASTTNLKEVVVNKGYYNTTSELNTGNVSSVSAKEIEEAPVSNVLSAIEGRVPGLLITQVTGMPGGSYTVQIRGQNSIANGSAPLYIVDGVPFDSTLLPNSFAGGGGNPLNYLNSMDIESIDVLKDADATAIYGSRGANGVVLITTKKGKSGDTK
ncbi:MAG TPA: TonB-dependent receptor plug domain-containing protein, partial [Mucilaginibacter sp.]